ncbi:MAG: carboxypeptidase regulatory-like domain-containing protein [Saprospiraceae bacterium]|nr:MAG: carboxypeptidase regulatory-like domain-containing protein [Saprospiraceae bacterium]
MKNQFFSILFSCVFLLVVYGCPDHNTPPCNNRGDGIFGTVTNTSTGAPIQGAEITLSGGQGSAVSGSDGKYFIKNLLAGTHQVQVQKAGFAGNNESIQISACDPDKQVDLKLTCLPYATPANLDFGTSMSEMTSTLANFSNEPFVFYTSTDRSWIAVYPSNGNLGIGQPYSITVSIDRTKFTGNVTGLVTVNATSLVTGLTLCPTTIAVSAKP